MSLPADRSQIPTTQQVRPRHRLARYAPLVCLVVLPTLWACDREDKVEPLQQGSEAEVIPTPQAPLEPKVEPSSPEKGENESPTASPSALANAPTAPADYAATVDTVKGLSEKEESLECFGGEQKLRVVRFTDQQELVKMALHYGAAGHRSWNYEIFYRDDAPVFARHRVETFSFVDGKGDGVTMDTVVERRYVFDAGKASRCEESRAEALTNEMNAQLAAATARTIPCDDASRITGLAQGAIESMPDKSWMEAKCQLKDPSSSMKLSK